MTLDRQQFGAGEVQGEGAGDKIRQEVGTRPQSVQFSLSVVYDYLQPHESQHAKPPCPSPTPGAYPNSCASSR